MKTARLLLALVAALLCAALLAGCGGTSKADYQKQVKKIGSKVEKDIDKLDSGSPSTKDIDAAHDSIDQAADDIDDIDPPSEVKDLHEDLVSTLHDTADVLDRLAPLMAKATKDPTSLGKDEQDEMADITKDFAKIQKEMTRIEAGYKKKKYDIGLGD
jgi:outer membrane murein-binding lipoprotein Lpp